MVYHVQNRNYSPEEVSNIINRNYIQTTLAGGRVFYSLHTMIENALWPVLSAVGLGIITACVIAKEDKKSSNDHRVNSINIINFNIDNSDYDHSYDSDPDSNISENVPTRPYSGAEIVVLLNKLEGNTAYKARDRMVKSFLRGEYSNEDYAIENAAAILVNVNKPTIWTTLNDVFHFLVGNSALVSVFSCAAYTTLALSLSKSENPSELYEPMQFLANLAFTTIIPVGIACLYSECTQIFNSLYKKEVVSTQQPKAITPSLSIPSAPPMEMEDNLPRKESWVGKVISNDTPPSYEEAMAM
jgi:hypothetical protein